MTGKKKEQEEKKLPCDPACSSSACYETDCYIKRNTEGLDGAKRVIRKLMRELDETKDELKKYKANPCLDCTFYDQDRHEPCNPCIKDKQKDGKIFMLSSIIEGIQEKCKKLLETSEE